MYEISSKLYQEVATRLVELAGFHGYISDSFEFEFEDVWCEMTISAVVYHQSSPDIGHSVCAVTDMIPVWWEFHTFVDGDEVLNDMSFDLIRENIQSLV
ncbi:MAG: hypothetical protein IKY76_07060 [Alistipes sp.]|nr:hypothetical protein [Alistipes sp.]